MSNGMGYEADFDYEGHYRRLEEAAKTFLLLLGTVDLNQLRAVLSSADSLGPFLDPTQYRDALHSGRLEKQRLLVAAGEKFCAACKQYGGDDGRI